MATGKQKIERILFQGNLPKGKYKILHDVVDAALKMANNDEELGPIMLHMGSGELLVIRESDEKDGTLMMQYIGIPMKEWAKTNGIKKAELDKMMRGLTTELMKK